MQGSGEGGDDAALGMKAGKGPDEGPGEGEGRPEVDGVRGG